VLVCSALTDTGKVRPHNEDYVTVRPEFGLMILADGMGGYQAGEVASRLSCETVEATLVPLFETMLPEPGPASPLRVWLHRAIDTANMGVFERAESDPALSGMGTTLLVAVLRGRELWLAHVGDSRAYLWTASSGLRQLTRDHSLLQEQLDMGLITPEQARVSIHRNLVTRAVGIDPLVEPDVARYLLDSGALLLLCSDGLTDMLSDTDIATVLARAPEDLNVAARELIDQANARGGRDNISVVLARVASDPAA
jgi:protein phosphatase